MTAKLGSPGLKSSETTGRATNIRGSAVGICYFLGVAEWGEVGVPTEVLSFDDYKRKFGGFISGYYLAESVDVFFRAGGAKAIVTRTCHYTAGVAAAVKATKTVQGWNAGDDDRPKVDTLKFTATGEGAYGNRINVTNKKVATESDGALSAAAQTYITVDDETNFEIGDIVDINDGVNWLRVVVTYIDTGTHRLYFTEVTLGAEMATDSVVETASRHAIRTTLAADLATDATSIALTSVSGIKVGQVLSIVDKQPGAPYDVTVRVTAISGSVIEFTTVGTITTITAANSEVVSQEFHLDIYLAQDKVDKQYQYLSMSSAFQKNYVENVINESSKYIDVADQGSTEDFIGDMPEVFENLYLVSGADGLGSLSENDFIGSSAYKNGLFAFDSEARRFAQIVCPDMRSVNFHTALKEYVEAKDLWAIFDNEFGRTPEQAKAYVLNTAMLNTRNGEYPYPNVKYLNPDTGVTYNIPACGEVAGLNARVWGAVGKGPWISPAGVEDGILAGIVGLENSYTQDVEYRDLLEEGRINCMYKYSPYGNVMYNINTLEANGDFPQKPERMTFLYCRHSIENGSAWIVFKNIDLSTKKRMVKSLTKFLGGVRTAGGLKGLTNEEAFSIDVSDTVNTPTREEAGELWGKIGLATKKAGKFVYFEFYKKVA